MNEYLGLADQLSEYVVKLLDKVRGHDELEKLLNKKRRDANDETYEQLSRLQLAIHYNEKKFVAHPSCQQKLVSIWYDDLRALERSNWFFRSLMVFCITIVYPLLAILYWFFPGSKVGKFLRYPCIKFIGHTMSFVTFLAMILISSAAEGASVQKKLSSFPATYSKYVLYKEESNLTLPHDFVLRTARPEIIQLCLSLWIIGMLWQEIKQVYGDGIYDYFDSLYNYLDVAVLTLYITSFTLRYVSITKVNTALEYFRSDDSWALLMKNHITAREQMYWLIADRFYWDAWDPHNIAEGMFAIANVISFTRVSYVLPANELFGPMQISLARMITDILKFTAIFLVLFVAFMVGLHNLYWYYPKSVRQQVEFLPNNITTDAESAFGIPDMTFRTVFWSLFGRGEPKVVELGDFNHYFTQNVGYCIFGAYNISTVIVLLNMLIAMMSRSFEIIQEEADTEWKFARSKLYMEYIKQDATLPIPFNIIPSPKSVFCLFNLCWGLCRRQEDTDLRPHPGRIKDIEMYTSSPSGQSMPGWDDNANNRAPKKGIKRFQERMQTTNGFVRSDSDPNIYEEKLTYKRVMKRIVKRYIFDVQRQDDRAEGDFDELKQDISSFRYEILNHLQNRQKEAKIAEECLTVMEKRLDILLQQQSMLLQNYSNSSNINHLSSNKNQNSNVDNDLKNQIHGNSSIESAYSSLEECCSFETDGGSSQKQLEDIPEEDQKEDNTANRSFNIEHDGSQRLPRQQYVDNDVYSVDDVIIHVNGDVQIEEDKL